MLGQFLVSILTRKPPVDLILVDIPPSGLCGNFVSQYLHILDPVNAFDINEHAQ